MSRLCVFSVCCLALGLVSGKAVFSESPTSSELNNDLAVIRFCNLTSPISLESMNSVLVNRQLTAVENAEGFKCFLHCLYNRYNWMDEEGGFLLRNMKSSLEATRLDDLTADWIIFKCSAVHSSDRCERAFKFTQCFWDETKEFSDEEDSALYRIH